MPSAVWVSGGLSGSVWLECWENGGNEEETHREGEVLQTWPRPFDFILWAMEVALID